MMELNSPDVARCNAMKKPTPLFEPVIAATLCGAWPDPAKASAVAVEKVNILLVVCVLSFAFVNGVALCVVVVVVCCGLLWVGFFC